VTKIRLRPVFSKQFQRCAVGGRVEHGAVTITAFRWITVAPRPSQQPMTRRNIKSHIERILLARCQLIQSGFSMNQETTALGFPCYMLMQETSGVFHARLGISTYAG
jgi:hypothetical protein